MSELSSRNGNGSFPPEIESILRNGSVLDLHDARDTLQAEAQEIAAALAALECSIRSDRDFARIEWLQGRREIVARGLDALQFELAID